MSPFNKSACAAAVLLLAGCSTNKPQEIYTWGDYQDTIYQYYNHESSPQEQIAALQKLIEQARAANKPVPPGVHAQLGMLYGNTGNSGLARAEFNAETTQYPESAAYINFLLAKKEREVK
ncbi:MAG: DUF4810 domain-containing protein [Pluralibacter gergoviae]|nr:DUF4810 domain-containing protein [Pluralibacter gergoviae]